MKSYKPIFLTILSAALLVLAFPTGNMWFLAWVAIIPFFIAIREQNYPNTFLLGFLWGIVFFYGAISWLNAISFTGTIALVLYLALYFALFAIFARPVIKISAPVFIKAILTASLWVILEFIRCNFLTGFGWVLLGYSQTKFLPAIQIADITGAWGVSFLVVFVNVAIYEFFFESGKPQAKTGLAHNGLLNLIFSILLVASIFIYGFYKLNYEPSTMSHQPIKISIIQGNIPQKLKWDSAWRNYIIEKYFSLTKEAAKDSPDLIIWPETSFPADFNSEPELADGLFQLAKATNAYLLVGSNRFIWKNKYQYEKIYNSAFLIGPDGQIKNCYDKLHLVPFGEYMPVNRLPKILLEFLPEKINMVGDFSSGKEYTVFKLPTPNSQLPTFSVLICFEDVFPDLSGQFVRNGANMLVNITNDGWYGPSSAAFQHAQASILRAVENRRPVVRSANTGLSVFIDDRGRVLSGVKGNDGREIFVAGYKTETIGVDKNPARTFYNKHPGMFIIICFLIFIAGFSIISFASIPKNRSTRGQPN